MKHRRPHHLTRHDPRPGAWTRFLDGLLAQSGRNIALLSAVAGVTWLIRGEFSEVHKGMARLEGQIAATQAGLIETQAGVAGLAVRLERIEQSVSYLAMKVVRLDTVMTERAHKSD